MKVKPSITRRTFLAAAGAGVAAPMILPRRVLGAPDAPAPSERVTIGQIGLGGMGTAHIRSGIADHLLAICDVDRNHLDGTGEALGEHVDRYTDYRRILDRQDIDAVLIAAPDHWHALMTIHACEAGKDVFCEKPACRTIEEGQKMIAAARRYDRVVQIGAQGRSTRGGYHACRFIRNGGIGEVKRVHIWHELNWSGGDPALFQDPPEYLDWEMWLGPAAMRPYHPECVHFNFRWIMDLAGGFVRDRGAHIVSLAHWFLDMDGMYPSKIAATGVAQTEGVWDVPLKLDATFEYPNGVVIEWHQSGPEEWITEHPYGAVFHGSEGDLIVEGGDGFTKPEDKAVEFETPAGGFEPMLVEDHRYHWLECVKTRARPNLDIEIGVDTVNVCNLANLSYQLGRPIEWDAEAMRVVGDEQANLMLSEPGRGEWQL